MNNLQAKVMLARKQERDKLFACTELTSNVDKYQRMRYEREIEGHIYVMLLRIGLSYSQAATKARQEADRIVANWRPTDSIHEIMNRYDKLIPINGNKTKLEDRRDIINDEVLGLVLY